MVKRSLKRKVNLIGMVEYSNSSSNRNTVPLNPTLMLKSKDLRCQEKTIKLIKHRTWLRGVVNKDLSCNLKVFKVNQIILSLLEVKQESIQQTTHNLNI